MPSGEGQDVTMDDAEEIDFDVARYKALIPHVFLPPQLPAAEEGVEDMRETSLLMCNALLASAEAYRDGVPDEEHVKWDVVVNMIKKVKTFVDTPLTRSSLATALKNMRTGDVLPLHIRAQNAAVIVRKNNAGASFEVFEASPANESVYSTSGKLVTVYPGPSVQVPEDIIQNRSFRDNLALFLSSMDVDELDSAATATKAGSTVKEVRDTTDPRYISQLLVGILLGCAGATDANATRVTKRIADEVIWDGALKPWRRHPLWLILRVALQTTLDDRNTYKSFMIFTMADMLDWCAKSDKGKTPGDFSSDILDIMHKKVARRLSKLGDATPAFVLKHVERACRGKCSLVEVRWKAVQSKQSGRIRGMRTEFGDALRFAEANTKLTLPNASPTLHATMNRAGTTFERKEFNPSYPQRLKATRNFSDFATGSLATAVTKDTPTLVLADFEEVVREGLRDWVAMQGLKPESSEPGCTIIFELFKEYQTATSKHYSATNLEDQSIAVLTQIALWVAIDRFTAMACPMLEDYSPEIPVTFFEPLVLRDERNMRLANELEAYLRARHDRAVLKSISIFTASSNEQSFTRRTYAQSTHHARLKKEIEDNAAIERQRKTEELQRLNEQYSRLRAQADAYKHTSIMGKEIMRIGRRKVPIDKHIDPACRKCQLEAKMREMTIEVHEWPLPEGVGEVEQVIVELSCPPTYSMWRDATYDLLTRTGKLDYTLEDKEEPGPAYPHMLLQNYPGLKQYNRVRVGNVGFGSLTRSFTSTHYGHASLPTIEEKVCVNNGLSYAYVDRRVGGRWVGALPYRTSNVTHLCLPTLPKDSRYAHLQHTMNGTEHTSNDAIADQMSCPKELSLHEHLSFASIRSGGRLQWLNIARELRARTLTHNTPEVHLLFAQALWQLGPLTTGDAKREWHLELGDPTFCDLVLREATLFLQSVGENWKEAITVRTIILVILRVLESSLDANVCQEARAALRFARATAVRFRDTLKDRMDQLRNASEEVWQAAQRQVCEAAATCVSTYDVSSDAHLELLLYSHEDLYQLVRSAVIAQEHMPPDRLNIPLHMQLLLRRHERALLRLEPRLRSLVHRNAGGMHDAIDSLWSSYRPDGEWYALATPAERQLSCTLVQTGGNQTAHYDLLTGVFLVGGREVNRLPLSITTHDVFKRLFGQMILDIVPATDPDMQYETRQAVSDSKWTVSFALRPGNLLLIRARPAAVEYTAGQTLELVPHNAFDGDLPQTFVQDYVHWLDLTSGAVEFRPKGSPWQVSDKNWCLNGLRNGAPRLRHGLSNIYLVDPLSSTFRTMHTVLGVLELPHFVIVTMDSGKLQIILPRLRLSFLLKSGTHILVCESIHGMVVDMTDQSSGTLFGLRNQLVLKASTQDERMLPGSRRAIVPHGTVSFTLDAHSHPSVDIQVDENASHVAYYDYRIEQDFGRVGRTSSITGRLFLCYLHAVTSSCLPDPLNGLTGTEQALQDLNSGHMWSFQSLSSNDMTVLGAITSLTPRHVFFPKHLAAMQQVTWNELPSLSQHAGFQHAADSILAFARDLALFHDDADRKIDLEGKAMSNRGDQLLLKRAARRNAVLYAIDTPSNDTASSVEDLQHNTRHSTSLALPDPSAPVLMVARLAREIQAPTEILQHSQLDVAATVYAQPDVSALPSASLSYSSAWLRAPHIWRHFLSFYRLCTAYDDDSMGGNRFQLIFSLCSYAFQSPKMRDTIFLLLSLCLNNSLRHECPAELYGDHNLHLTLANGSSPNRGVIQTLLKDHCPERGDTPADRLVLRAGEAADDFAQRKRRARVRGVQLALDDFVDLCMDQWKQAKPVPPRKQWLIMDFAGLDLSHSINAIPSWLRNTATGLGRVASYMESCKRNSILLDHLGRIQTELRKGGLHVPDIEMLAPLRTTFEPVAVAPSQASTSIATLLRSRQPPNITPINTMPERPDPSSRMKPPSLGGLRALSARVRGFSDSAILYTYQTDLDKSIRELALMPPTSLSTLPSRFRASSNVRPDVEKQLASVNSHYSSLKGKLGPVTPPERQLEAAGLWPKISKCGLLGLLSKDRVGTAPEEWCSTLRAFGHGVLTYQRLQRLLDYAVHRRPEEALKELDNTALEDAQGEQDPLDWLLVQIDSNFLARRVQRSVAREMIDPSSGQNSLFQLNMGEGKSSVIVPFAVTSLASGQSLVRVVVLKALSNAMFDLLVDRLGGLANRRVFHLPFSRNLAVTEELVETMKSICETCIRVGGILVIQPEHILSFKLTGLDYLVSRSPEQPDNVLASALWGLKRWLSDHTRDILDESDELLHARYQLIYTIGHQQPIDGHPQRWIILQQVLLVLKDCISTLAAVHPRSILFSDEHGARFPTIRLLNSDIDGALTGNIIDRIMSGALPSVPFSTLPEDVRAAIVDFIGSPVLTEATCSRVRRALSENVWKGVLLLRGLLAPTSGVLLYVFKQRRWRVDFGLDPTRSLLAVPYRAKDVPSLRAEFGHPDVAIVLTCLSYCYGGLNSSQVVLCFERLFKMEDPRQEYSIWVGAGGATVPPDICHLSGVNLEDATLVENKLVPTFSLNYAVIFFFLNHVVFPIGAKEFPQKLGSSAWDLAERKPNVTTGFSGTKDNRFLLPTTISQTDPPEQRGTDALVLSNMLRAENAYNAYTGIQSGEHYLRFIMLQEPQVRVLLDVGAQMLDMRNQELALRWLHLSDDNVQAAIFFTDADDLAVVTRDGVVERLRTSPLNEQLDKCIVYLDDAHTRGTDLKLPKEYRAALTLGQKVAKDRLVQGAMRMRKLGHGQSVLIVAPPEIDNAIRKATRVPDDEKLDLCHVLQWAMLETCEDIARHIPHWAEQGVDYARRGQAESAYDVGHDIDSLRLGWLRPEARTLAEMYGTTAASQVNQTLWQSVQAIVGLRDHLERLGVTSIGSARLAEEQEREVVLEVERERQVYRPPKVDPAKHSLHQDVIALARSGNIPPRSAQFLSLFCPVHRAGDAWDPRLLATRDFIVTLAAVESLPKLHDYMRPVSWVLSLGFDTSMQNVRLVVISPYEANHLLPLLRTNTSSVRLHVFTPRLVRNMPSMSDLRFHTVPTPLTPEVSVPRLLCSQLGLWAGVLWLDDHATYKEICLFLGLYMGYTADEIRSLQGGGHIGSDGFIRPEGRGLLVAPSSFQQSPVERLRELFAFRRKSVDYASTHIGRVLSARQLREIEDWRL